MRASEPDAGVCFGATGDRARKKIFPSLPVGGTASG